MAEQVQRLVAGIITGHGVGEGGEIGHIAAPIVDPYQTRIVHVVRGVAVAAMLKHTDGIAGQQEIPNHFAVFAGEFGEAVGDDDRATECRGGAILAQCVESMRVIAAVVQLAGLVQFGQFVTIPVDGGRIHPAFRHASVQRGQHLAVHLGVVMSLVDKRESHIPIIRIPI